jgi:hypothetical protein
MLITNRGKKYVERLPSQDAWTPRLVLMSNDGHTYSTKWPLRTTCGWQAARACNQNIIIPDDERGLERWITLEDAATSCRDCIDNPTIWNVMASAAWASWPDLERYHRRWMHLKSNTRSDRTSVAYSWPYRLFVNSEGAWRIVDVEKDGVPECAVTWCGLVSDCAKDTTYNLCGELFRRTGHEHSEQISYETAFFDVRMSRLLHIREFIKHERDIITAFRAQAEERAQANWIEDDSAIIATAKEAVLENMVSAWRKRQSFTCISSRECFGRPPSSCNRGTLK